MKNAAYFLLGAAVVGGVVYVATKKKEPEPTPQVTPSGGLPVLPSYVSDELVAMYTKCYNGQCSLLEYKNVEGLLQGLATQHPESAAMFHYFADELAKRQPTQPPPPQLPTDYSIKMTYQPLVDKCWAYNCSVEGVNDLISTLQTLYTSHSLDHPSVAAGISDVINAMLEHYGRSTSGIVGRHTGACSCAMRQEDELNQGRSTGHSTCCASCASGGECEECGEEEEHELQVG